jgi:hypothetical protein
LSRRHDPAADYAWRVRIERTEWRYALRVIAGELDYRDFKAAVATRQGRERAGVYEWVWRALTSCKTERHVRKFSATR